MENLVNSSKVRINGRRIGNERTGYSVPLLLAFEMIAAIIVDDIAMPKLPSINAAINVSKAFMLNESKSRKNKTVIAIFIIKTRRTLNNNLPEKMVDGFASSCSVRVVPRSSSDTNARDKPDMAEKKTTTHNNPPVRYSEMFSCPIENRITLIVTSMNIANAFIA